MKSRQRERQARKALVWGLVSFAGVQLGLIVVMEYWLPQLRDPNYVFKAARLKQRIREAESRGDGSKPRVVVMVGSSRVTDGLRGSMRRMCASGAALAGCATSSIASPASTYLRITPP